MKLKHLVWNQIVLALSNSNHKLQSKLSWFSETDYAVCHSCVIRTFELYYKLFIYWLELHELYYK